MGEQKDRKRQHQNKISFNIINFSHVEAPFHRQFSAFKCTKHHCNLSCHSAVRPRYPPYKSLEFDLLHSEWDRAEEGPSKCEKGLWNAFLAPFETDSALFTVSQGLSHVQDSNFTPIVAPGATMAAKNLRMHISPLMCCVFLSVPGNYPVFGGLSRNIPESYPGMYPVIFTGESTIKLFLPGTPGKNYGVISRNDFHHPGKITG